MSSDEEEVTSIFVEESIDGKGNSNGSPILLKAGVTAAFFPLECAKILMQIGYEPFQPINSYTMLGRRCLLLPNSFQYVKYLKSVDGLAGCFRGLGPRLLQQSVFMYVNALTGNVLQVSEFTEDSSPMERDHITLSAHIGPAGGGGDADNGDDDINEGDEEEEEEVVRVTSFSRRNSEDIGNGCVPWIVYIKKMSQEWLCRTTGLIVSFPFQVIAVRTIAEFVGREDNFTVGVFRGVFHIYEDHGILGFFHGLVPRLIGDSIHLFLCGALRYLVRSQVYTEEVRACLNVSIAVLVGSFTYPFTVVSNTMAVCGSRHLAMGKTPLMPEYKNWIECWKHLASINQLRRGSSVFFRYYTGPRKLSYNGLFLPVGVPFGPNHLTSRPVTIN